MWWPVLCLCSSHDDVLSWPNNIEYDWPRSIGPAEIDGGNLTLDHDGGQNPRGRHVRFWPHSHLAELIPRPHAGGPLRHLVGAQGSCRPTGRERVSIVPPAERDGLVHERLAPPLRRALLERGEAPRLGGLRPPGKLGPHRILRLHRRALGLQQRHRQVRGVVHLSARPEDMFL
ncbi:hypothetical protein T492DRAFT_982197 [Pavlovales sp. CCMP2436]|nr:hypothetical protein T492DRAFT_982197 [Pavlovales sp. CCMP2436]